MLPATVKEKFITLLMETGNVSMSARMLGINRMTAYGWKEDPSFVRKWELAMNISRQNLKERVVETAERLGVGRWVPVLDSLTEKPLLDDDFEPLMRFETKHVDARVLMKLMDKTMRDEVQRVDQRTLVAGRIEHEHSNNLVLVDAEGNERPLLPTDASKFCGDEE